MTKDLIKKVADKWYREDGSAKFRTMIQHMIINTMQEHKLPLREAAKLLEKAMLFYKDEHVVGGPEAYWGLVKGMEEGKTWSETMKRKVSSDRIQDGPVVGRIYTSERIREIAAGILAKARRKKKIRNWSRGSENRAQGE